MRSNYNRYWHNAVQKAGLAGLGLHFHDLRHTANGFAARETNVRELMARMGHASVRAALIYQHVTPEREREVAQALSKRIEAERRDAGTPGAPIWHGCGTAAGAGEDQNRR